MCVVCLSINLPRKVDTESVSIFDFMAYTYFMKMTWDTINLNNTVYPLCKITNNVFTVNIETPSTTVF